MQNTGFGSILGPGSDPLAIPTADDEPACFGDLNIDMLVAALTKGREDYDLRPFLQAPLRDLATIGYRQEVMRDLQRPAVREAVEAFAVEMRRMRELLERVKRGAEPNEAGRWFLAALECYVGLTRGLVDGLRRAEPASAGLQGFAGFLASYVASADFSSLSGETAALASRLAGIRYSLWINGDRIRVGRFAGEPDYGAEVRRTFARFREAADAEYEFHFPVQRDMNEVEIAVLDRVARLFPDTFAEMASFRPRHVAYLDGIIGRFDREIQFYLAWLDHAAPLEQAGLQFCYPELADHSKSIYANELFDIVLADKLVAQESAVVTNDVRLEGPERVLVVSGPNQGGKTTFARAIGQLHVLAALGYPVPGTSARLFLFDELFTHFEREESLETMTGKLDEELLRIHAILERATPRSVLIMNESFGSTTLQDAVYLSRQVVDRIIDCDVLCVFVTFLDEVATLGPSTVSMVGNVDPADPAVRTFRIVRRPPDGLAYALAIAEKYGLTYQHVVERIGS